MGVVFVNVGMTLDGFIAPDGMDLEHAHDPSHKDWLNRWMKLHDWVVHQQFFRRNLQLGEEGETGQDNALVERTFNRTGATILGKRMFDGGEHSWPEEAPFHTPVFVLTHQMRESRGNDPAAPPSTSSTTESKAPSNKRGKWPQTKTSASGAEPM